jgi:hypothetical protein
VRPRNSIQEVEQRAPPLQLACGGQVEEERRRSAVEVSIEKYEKTEKAFFGLKTGIVGLL